MIIRHTGVFGKIIACCESHGAKFTSIKNTVVEGEKSQIAILRMKADSCFHEEVLAIEGVLGAACVPLH